MYTVKFEVSLLDQISWSIFKDRTMNYIKLIWWKTANQNSNHKISKIKLQTNECTT